MRRLITMVAVLLASSAFSAAQPVHVAVIPGEGGRAPREGLVDLLGVELSKQEQVALLERKEVDRLLHEHEMSAAGVPTPEQSIEMGRLLGADVMLFVAARREQGKCSLHRFRYVEAATGVVLSDLLLDVEQPDASQNAVVNNLQEAFARLAQPKEERSYVALLGYGLEQGVTAESLPPLALRALVARELGRAEGVVLVDREHLALLQDEVFLTGVARNYAVSAYHVDGLIRTDGGTAGSFEIQTVVKPLAGPAHPAIRTFWQPGRESTPWREIAAAILTQIDAAPPRDGDADRETEARDLESHGASLKRYGEKARSLAAFEAAHVLNPTPANAIEVARGLRATVGQYPTGCDGEETRKRRDLHTLTRAFQLWQVFMQDVIEEAEDGAARNRHFPTGAGELHHLGGLWRTLRSENAETRALYERLRALKLEARETQTRYCRAMHGSPGSPEYFHWTARNERSDIRCMSETTEEYVAELKAFIDGAIAMSGYATDYMLSRLLSMPERVVSVAPPVQDTDADRDALMELSEWMQSHPREVVRLWGDFYETYVRFTFDGKDYHLPALRLLDRLDGYMATHQPNDCINHMCHRCLGFVGVERYMQGAERYFNSVLERLDALAFVSWYTSSSDRWNRWLRKTESDFYVAWLRKAVVKLTPEAPPADLYEKVRRAGMLSVRDRLARELSLFSAEHAAPEEVAVDDRHWRAYRIVYTPPHDFYTGGYSLALLKRAGDALLAVWTQTSYGSLELRVRVMNLEGRVLWDAQPFRQSLAGDAKAGRVVDVTAGKGHVYVALQGAGLLIASPTSTEVLGRTNGLAPVKLSALAWAKDRLVIGYASDYLQVLNTDDRSLSELAYSRSPLRRNALDGCRTRFSVQSLLAESDSGPVWMTTTGPDGTWRIDLATGELKRVAGRAYGVLSRNEGRIHCTGTSSVAELDQVNRKWRGIRLHGDVSLTTYPHLVMARDAFSAGRHVGLYLHKTSQKKAIRHPTMPAADFMVRTGPDTAILATRDGGFWRLSDRGTVFSEEADYRTSALEQEALRRSLTNQIAVTEIAASSHVVPPGDRTFEPEQAGDGDPTTCWAADTNNVRGAWLTLSEVTFLTVTPHQEDAGDAGPASSRTAQIRGME